MLQMHRSNGPAIKKANSKLNTNVTIYSTVIFAIVAFTIGTVIVVLYSRGNNQATSTPVAQSKSALTGFIEIENIKNTDGSSPGIQNDAVASVDVLQNGLDIITRGINMYTDEVLKVFYINVLNQTGHNGRQFYGQFYYIASCPTCTLLRQDFIDKNYINKMFVEELNKPHWMIKRIHLLETEQHVSTQQWEQVEKNHSAIAVQRTIGQHMILNTDIELLESVTLQEDTFLDTVPISSWLNQKLITLTKTLKPNKLTIKTAHITVKSEDKTKASLSIQLIAIYNRQHFFEQFETSKTWIHQFVQVSIEGMEIIFPDGEINKIKVVIDVNIIFGGVSDTTSSESSEAPVIPMEPYSKIQTRLESKIIGQYANELQITNLVDRISEQLCLVIGNGQSDVGAPYHAKLKSSAKQSQTVYDLTLYYKFPKPGCTDGPCADFIQRHLQSVLFDIRFMPAGMFDVIAPANEFAEMEEVSLVDWQPIVKERKSCFDNRQPTYKKIMAKITLKSTLETLEKIKATRSSIQLKICLIIKSLASSLANPLYMQLGDFLENSFDVAIIYPTDIDCSSNECSKIIENHFSDVSYHPTALEPDVFSLIDFDVSSLIDTSIVDTKELESLQLHCSSNKYIETSLKLNGLTGLPVDELKLRINNAICDIFATTAKDLDGMPLFAILGDAINEPVTEFKLKLYYPLATSQCGGQSCTQFIEKHFSNAVLSALKDSQTMLIDQNTVFNEMIPVSDEEWTQIEAALEKCKTSDRPYQQLNGAITVIEPGDNVDAARSAIQIQVCAKLKGLTESNENPYFIFVGNYDQKKFEILIYFKSSIDCKMAVDCISFIENFKEINYQPTGFAASDKFSIDDIQSPYLTVSSTINESNDLEEIRPSCISHKYLIAKLTLSKIPSDVTLPSSELNTWINNALCDRFYNPPISWDGDVPFFAEIFSGISREGTYNVKMYYPLANTQCGGSSCPDFFTDYLVQFPLSDIEFASQLTIETPAAFDQWVSLDDAEWSEVEKRQKTCISQSRPYKKIKRDLTVTGDISSEEKEMETRISIQKRLCAVVDTDHSPYYISIGLKSANKKYDTTVFYDVSTDCDKSKCKKFIQDNLQDIPYMPTGITKERKFSVSHRGFPSQFDSFVMLNDVSRLEDIRTFCRSHKKILAALTLNKDPGFDDQQIHDEIMDAICDVFKTHSPTDAGTPIFATNLKKQDVTRFDIHLYYTLENTECGGKTCTNFLTQKLRNVLVSKGVRLSVEVPDFSKWEIADDWSVMETELNKCKAS